MFGPEKPELAEHENVHRDSRVEPETLASVALVVPAATAT
jgi:hypothetical protein